MNKQSRTNYQDPSIGALIIKLESSLLTPNQIANSSLNWICKLHLPFRTIETYVKSAVASPHVRILYDFFNKQTLLLDFYPLESGPGKLDLLK